MANAYQLIDAWNTVSGSYDPDTAEYDELMDHIGKKLAILNELHKCGLKISMDNKLIEIATKKHVSGVRSDGSLVYA